MQQRGLSYTALLGVGLLQLQPQLRFENERENLKTIHEIEIDPDRPSSFVRHQAFAFPLLVQQE